MKKLLLTLVFGIALNSVNAQSKKNDQKENDFNRWSFELVGGFNKPARPLTSGYYTSVLSPYTIEFGGRYMFNSKFGLKTDFGYNSFTGNDKSFNFDSKYYRLNLQSVVNLARVMNFETWTKSIGLLGHAGFGLSFLERKDPTIVKDKIGNFIAGVTGQIKLSNKVALTGDFSTIVNAKQHVTFDGFSAVNRRGFNGYLFTGTVGLTVYLGKKINHADWNISNEVKSDEIDSKLMFKSLENKLLDTDKDGVANYLDEDPNTPAGSLVDVKGKSIDKNKNGIADVTEDFITKNNPVSETKSPVSSNNELISSLINGSYIAVYFDFDKSQPTNVSNEGIDFILTYLRNNPTASIDIYGHADEIGRTEYNDKLSNSRATNVKNTLVKSNIDVSRLNVITAGEDTSVDVDSENARKLVRRVTFRIK